LGQYIYNSFNQARNGFFKSVPFLGTSFSSAMGYLLFLHKELELTPLKSIFLAIGVLLSAFLFRFFYFLVISSWKHLLLQKRETIYGDTIILLKDAFSKVHVTRNLSPNIPDDAFINTMRFLCDKLKEIFDNKTKSNCSVCIKVLKPDGSEETNQNYGYVVTTLCRDNEASKRDQNPKYSSIKHRVFANTCFNTILSNFYANKKTELFFFQNSLPKLENYMNTSFEAYGELSKEVKTEKGRRTNWTLPYKSEIVVPIIPNLFENNTELKLIGFICIDCKDENLFEEKYDIPIIQGVAEGIYDLFFSRSKSKEQIPVIYYENEPKITTSKRIKNTKK
jgi:hypothetical protein